MSIEIVVREIGRRQKREIRLSRRAAVVDLLKQLGQNREMVVVRINGKIVAEEEHLKDGDVVEIIPIVTGG
ncbi:MAG: thiamine biosynthesis protein ThiS [Hadesarchaea archaeon]|nr:MAG: thiamine biosynthesis protein ThiS [Hadesarchaea archaeon]